MGEGVISILAGVVPVFVVTAGACVNVVAEVFALELVVQALPALPLNRMAARITHSIRMRFTIFPFKEYSLLLSGSAGLVF
jgi:hypothetical protein